MRDVCRCALPLVHTSLARRVASGPPNPLVAARLHGSAPHARSASPHVDPCQHVKYPLVPVRFALTRHAACMLNAADQVGYPTTPRPSRRIGVPHIHTFPTFTPLPPLPLSEDTKARRPSRPPPTASPGRPPSLPHCQRPLRAHVAMGVGHPCMHGDVARTHGLYVAVVAAMAVGRGALSCPTL